MGRMKRKMKKITASLTAVAIVLATVFAFLSNRVLPVNAATRIQDVAVDSLNSSVTAGYSPLELPSNVESVKITTSKNLTKAKNGDDSYWVWQERDQGATGNIENLGDAYVSTLNSEGTYWIKYENVGFDKYNTGKKCDVKHSVATQKKEELDIVQDFEEEQSVIPTEGLEEKKESEGEEKKDKSEEPLTAEVFYQYLQTQDIEGSVMLRHAQDGDMVTIMSPEIEVTAVFAIKEPWFDIKKKIEVTHKIRRLIRNWNNSQNELTFSYDSVDHTVTGTGDFATDKTAEELFNYLDGLLDKYFDSGEKK